MNFAKPDTNQDIAELEVAPNALGDELRKIRGLQDGEPGNYTECSVGLKTTWFPTLSSIMDDNYLAEFIKAKRREQEVSQERLAEMSSVSLRTIKRVEKGQGAKKDTINKLLIALGYQIVERIEPIETK